MDHYDAESDDYRNTIDILADIIRDIQRAIGETSGDDGLVASILDRHGIEITYDAKAG